VKKHENCLCDKEILFSFAVFDKSVLIFLLISANLCIVSMGLAHKGKVRIHRHVF